MLAATAVLVTGAAHAAAPNPVPAASGDRLVIPPPPPGFDARRPLDPDDYRRKNERGYVTGLPLFNYDSNFGFGGGARAYYFWNGTREDPRFGYTPYLHRVFLQAFATTGGLQFHWLDYDVPSLAGTPFRFRSQLIFIRNTDQHHFAIGSRALDRFSFPGSAATFERYADFQAALDQVTPAGTTWHRYNRFRLTQPVWIASVERTFLRGLLRPMLGLGFNHYGVHSYGGQVDHLSDANGTPVDAVNAPTRLDEDCAGPAPIVGCGGGWDNYLRLGVSLDTRDFEPDPNRGVFVDVAVDLGTRLLGSDYQWARFMAAARAYFSLLPPPGDLVLAVRGTFQVQSDSTPFEGMNLIPYIEDPRQGLGGLRTMRGFQQDRFVGPAMLLGNLELRWTFVRFVVLKQKLALIAVPFFDIGTVADRLGAVRGDGWRWDAGGALRISWNLATILTIDYGRSREDAGLFVNFNHIF